MNEIRRILPFDRPLERQACYLAIRSYSLCFFLAWFCLNSDLLAQNRTQIPNKVPSILADGSVKPDAIHLRSNDGEAIYVPLQHYEDFEKYYREKLAGSSPSLPRNLLESLTGEVRIGEGFADVDWIAQAQIGGAGAAIYRIPLGMSNQNLTESPAIQPGLASFIRLAPSGGYEWCLQVDEARKYEIRFRTRMKLTTLGTQSTLRFSLADVPCKLILSLRGANQEIQATGSGSPVVESSVEGDVTRATVVSIGGTLNLSWKNAKETDSLDSLEVDSVTRWELGASDRPWSGVSRFTVRAFGRKRAREFVIQLPNGMRWSNQQNLRQEEGIELLPVEGSLEDKDAEGAKSLKVRLSESAQDGPLEINIGWEWTRLPDATGHFELEGPVCQGVERQEGRLELEIPSGYRLGWMPNSEVIPLQQDRPTDVAGSERYTFRVNAPRYVLQGSLSREESRVRIRPRYWIHVESQRVTLEGMIEFAVDPNTITDLRMHLGGWVLDQLEFEGRSVDFDTADDGAIKPRIQDLNLNPVSNPTGTVTQQIRGLKLTAFIPWNVDAGSPLKLDFPRISCLQSNSPDRLYDHGTGGCVLSHASNVRLKNETQTLEGLISEQRMPPSMEGWNTSNSKLEGRYFRFQSETVSPNWTGSWIRLPQKILVRREFSIDLEEPHLRTSQLFKLHIENEPLAKLRLLVPKNLVEPTSPESEYLHVLIDGNPVDWTPTPMESVQELPKVLDTEAWSLIELVGSDFSGQIDLQIDSSSQTPLLDNERKASASLAFVWPVFPSDKEYLLDSQIQFNNLSKIQCRFEPIYQAEPARDWMPHRQLALPRGTYSIPMEMQRMQGIVQPDLQVERIWLQTALNQQQQRDRFVCRFSTEDATFQLRLLRPNQDQPFQEVFILNGVRVEPTIVANQYTFDLSRFKNKRSSHVLEVWSWLPRSRRYWEKVAAPTPLFENANVDIPFLWQIMLTPGDTMVMTSPGLVPEFRWTWETFGFVRGSQWNQALLEDWVGASRQNELGGQTANYVLSNVGGGPDLWLMSAPRHILWLPVASLFLIFFGLWSRYTLVRQPIVLSALAIAIASLIPVAPDFAILVIQTLALTLPLGLIIYITKWTLDHRLQKRTVFANRHSTWTRGSVMEVASKPMAAPTSTQAHEAAPVVSPESR